MFVLVPLLAGTFACGFLGIGDSEDADAATWTSAQWYVKDIDGHYAYRVTSFDFCCWQGQYVAIQRIGLSARITSPLYSYNGWNMAYEKTILAPPFGTPVYRSNSQYEPSFFMNSSSGWQTRNQHWWGDAVVNSWYPVAMVYGFTCHDENDCAEFYLSYGRASKVVGGLTLNASTGHLVDYAQ